MVRVLMPWNERVAVSAVEALKAISLPARYSFKVNKEDPKHYNISVGIVPTSNDKVWIPNNHSNMLRYEKKKRKENEIENIIHIFSFTVHCCTTSHHALHCYQENVRTRDAR